MEAISNVEVSHLFRDFYPNPLCAGADQVPPTATVDVLESIQNATSTKLAEEAEASNTEQQQQLPPNGDEKTASMAEATASVLETIQHATAATLKAGLITRD